MIVTTLAWDKVTVDYENGGQDIYKRAQVSFDSEIKSLTILQPGSENGQKHLLLARAELIKMTPWAMEWRAYFWSSTTPDMTLASIKCEF